jgi:hypothetical protein
MSKLINFPAVEVRSPSTVLKQLGVDEGTILEYNPASGMYVLNKKSEEDDDGTYFHFAEAIGFSRSVIDALLELNVVVTIPFADLKKDEGAEEPDVDVWDKADLTMVCGRCGAEEKVTEAIGGSTLFMPTTSLAETRLVCNVCGNTMSLLYRNGSMMTEEEKAEFKVKQEAAQKEVKKQREGVTVKSEGEIKQTDAMTPDEEMDELIKEDIDHTEVLEQNYRDNLELEEDESQEKSE